MSEIRIAARYAKSLMELAIEKGLLEQVNFDMRTLQSVCKKSPDLVNVLKSPIIKSDKKIAVLTGVFGNIPWDKLNINGFFENFSKTFDTSISSFFPPVKSVFGLRFP